VEYSVLDGGRQPAPGRAREEKRREREHAEIVNIQLFCNVQY
jgi:hypothetical protein